MVAARMAVPFLQEVELGKRPKLPKSIKRQSLNPGLAERVVYLDAALAQSG